MFPITLMGTGENWNKVVKMSTTDYLKYDNRKFSKSNNIGIFG